MLSWELRDVTDYIGREDNIGVVLEQICVDDEYAFDTITKCLDKFIPWGKQEVYFLCIGTDRSTGDSLGPIVGTFLEKFGVDNVVGTLKEPAHGTNLDERVQEIPEDSFIISVDACLGSMESVGNIKVIKGPCEPGKGVGKNLTKVGDLTVVYVVNAGHNESLLSHMIVTSTRLYHVMKGAEIVARAIYESYRKHMQICDEKINEKINVSSVAC